MDQKTGDALADGSVKAGYRQNAQGEVTHVLAGRAELKKASETTVFYGETGRPARLWQGGSQVEAPLLEFAQKQRKLVARGEHGEAMAVHTLLVGSGAANAAGKGEPGRIENSSTAGILRKASAVRVESREMVYSDESRTAAFTGGVKVESRDGVMRGQQATVLLEPSSQAGTKKSASEGFLGGSVERVVVSGGIESEQPGRRATGERLVYTAGDGVFELTGTAATPPRVVDQARGTVTGAELRFRAQDESVVISNGDTSSSGQRVRTETRVNRER
jgi:lipopolysaccharide export system protein LptA